MGTITRATMPPVLVESFPCPRCARKIVRPVGSETWCVCGHHFSERSTIDMIIECMNQKNEILEDMAYTD